MGEGQIAAGILPSGYESAPFFNALFFSVRSQIRCYLKEIIPQTLQAPDDV
jgi:hypothetical protein